MIQITEHGVGKPSDTRIDIIYAAAHEFAYKPYSLVNLDDVLARADVTKSAMYTHFESKHALARAVVEHRAQVFLESVEELRTPSSSALENLISATYLIAVADVSDDLARAGLNLLAAIGRFDGVQGRIVDEWVTGFAGLAQQAVAEGDLLNSVDPVAVARTVVSQYLGLRQTSNIDEPKVLIGDLEAAWSLTLPGFVRPERLDFFRDFLRRRSAVATRNTASLGGGPL